MSIRDETAAVADYLTRRYGTNRNRHWWGIAHRRRLLSGGRYINTSEMNRPCWAWVGESGPELGNVRGDDLAPLTCWCGRIACRHHQPEQDTQ